MHQVIKEAIQFINDQSKAKNDFIYEIAKWDDETRAAFILAYRIVYEKEK